MPGPELVMKKFILESTAGWEAVGEAVRKRPVPAMMAGIPRKASRSEWFPMAIAPKAKNPAGDSQKWTFAGLPTLFIECCPGRRWRVFRMSE